MYSNTRLALVSAISLSLVACSYFRPAAPTAKDEKVVSATDSTAAAAEASSAFKFIDSANFDPNTTACSNFFQHANGGWLARTEIPADQSSWGSFNMLAERGLDDLRTILDAAVAKSDTTGVEKLVGDFYAAGMDEARIEASGFAPIAASLADINALQTQADIVRYIHSQHAKGQPVVFGFGSSPDFQDSSKTIGYAGQGGLGLPDRDYYLRTDEDSKKLLDAYRTYLKSSFVLAGTSEDAAAQMAEDVVSFETKLAQASITRVERRDPKNQYRLVTIAQANKETPNFNWTQYFSSLKINVESFSMTSPKFFAQFDTMLSTTPASSWRNYFTARLLRSSQPFLSKPFVDLNFDFFSKTLNGVKEQRPRWKRIVQATSGSLGEPLGQLYVAKHFPPEAKAQAMALIADLKVALKARLENLEWMGDDTKRKALEKFATFTPKVGYPDKWRDFSGLSFSRTDFVGNLQVLAAFERQFDLNKIGKPTDRSRWGMSPQTVNAYYSPLSNEIVFPAAILQFPFFDPKADPAINYGGIGAVIGHELLHGFDDSGSKFDASGAQRNWWTETDLELFNSRTKRLEEHAGATTIGDLRINGKLTLGENIADLGGSQIAFDALQLAQARTPVGDIDGLNQNQRFFYSWAQIWRRAMRPEALKVMINTDPHSPSLYRVNGPLMNQATFAKAFGCMPGDGMINPDPVKIW